MKYLDPKNDLIFKKVFGQHPDILRSFLNSMLPLPEGREIVELEYLSPEMIPETFLEKFTSVDVRCKDNFGRQFLVEMQMNWTTAFKQRVLFNASKAYVTQSHKGSEFRSLKPVYALNLINENYLPQSPDYYHHYAVVHLQDSNERLHGLEFVFIELEKFKAQNITEKKLQVLWLRFLTEINEKTGHIAPELLEHPEIQKALESVMEASMSKEEMMLYEKNWDRISSEKTLLSAAREDGWKEGIAMGIPQGEVRGVYKSAIAMLRKQFSIEQIANILPLSQSKIAELKKLLDQYGDSAEDHLG
ncbi:MAG: Rpn family recombination-promoting nuclease/putative transposase [Bacteroidetes bacterium]|nr:MAG: Rpn family recombination-promoting nuclease/putative transposase [Bacteroidota bacterium]